MKYTGDNYTPHFGGLWAPLKQNSEDDERQHAILFIGDCYMFIFEYLPGQRALNHSSHSYVLEEDTIYFMSMHAEEDDELDEMRWRITDDRLLGLEENGRERVWEPVRIEQLAKEGFPVAAIEGYRKAFTDNGFSYTIEGVIPTQNTFRAIRKFRKHSPNA